jgi:RimJ/RimL family protein N-acetyltransferase
VTADTIAILTERLILRRWKKSDTEPFVALNKDGEVMKYFPALLSEQQTLEFLERIDAFFEQSNYGLYAVEIKTTGEFIGYTGFAKPSFNSFFTPCVEIGWRIAKEFWGMGYASEAGKGCLDYGFKKLGFDRVVSFTSLLNVKSENVMKRIGMTKIGEFDHPNLQPSSPLCRHVLYEIKNKGQVDMDLD